MLQIYPVILSFVEEVAPIIGRISRCDPDLARQLRRSSAAVALNTAEGMYARGRSRTHSYNVALREMRESYAALEVSCQSPASWSQVPAVSPPSWSHLIARVMEPPRGVG